jgi:sugar phosphate isomerase/epimerase
MRVGNFHLTYCTNIHAGESWPDVRAAIGDVLPRVRRRLGVDGPFGIGLRLSADAAATLAAPPALAEFRHFLQAHDHYVFTINGFPFGAFHRERVKEQVYLPDWRDVRRVEYSNQLAEILASLLPDDIATGSVSTVPGAFKPHLDGPADVEAVARGIRAHAAFLDDVESRTGRRIRLALEPEPSCLLETVDETCAFFDRYLADARVRRYVGVCVDTCHMAVAYEDPSELLDTLTRAGIDIVKVQISSALDVTPADVDALRPFAEDTYLHQVVARHGATPEHLARLERFVDLPDALAAPAAHTDWRVHFHVPLFLERLGALSTTQRFVSSFLDALRANPVCDQLEVETYTWDVLPAEHRTLDVADAIARELAWVRAALT